MPNFLITNIYSLFPLRCMKEHNPSQLLASLENTCHHSETIVKEPNVNLKRIISKFIIWSILL